MSRNNEPSLAQLEALLKLVRGRGVTQKRMEAVLSSGILADVLDSIANLGDRYAVRTALGIPNFKRTKVGQVTIEAETSTWQLGLPNYPDDWENERMLAKQNAEQVPEHLGTYECMFLRPMVKSCTLETLERLAADILQKGAWQPAKEVHLTACIRAYGRQDTVPERVLAHGSWYRSAPYATLRPVFSKGYGMCGWVYGVGEKDIREPLEGICVLYVRKVG